MKKISITIYLLISTSLLFSQIAFYDAINLSKQLNTAGKLPENKEVYGILKNYVKKNDTTNQQIYNDLRRNPFIMMSSIVNVSDYSSKTSFSLESLGGLDVTTIADGMARFIVNRAKKELNVFFFDQFKQRMDSIVELQTLFPNTAQLLNIIGSEIYNYDAYIVSLRGAFENDLSGLYTNFPKLLDKPKYVKAFEDFPELKYILSSSFSIIDQLNNDVHPGDIINEFPMPDTGNNNINNIYSSIRTFNLFSQAIRSKDKNKYWVGKDSLNLLKDEKIFRIFMGLVYQQTKDDIVFKYQNNQGTDTTFYLKKGFHQFGKTWSENSKKVDALKNYIINFGPKVDAINISLKGLKAKKEQGKVSYNDIYSFLDASFNFLDYAAKVKDLPYMPQKLADHRTFDYYNKYMFVARQGNDLYLNISERNYGVAIMNLVRIKDTIITDQVLNNIAERRTESIIKKRITRIDADIVLLSKDGEGGKPRKEKKLKEEKNSLESNLANISDNEIFKDYRMAYSSIQKYIIKYGTFMATIVDAETSVDVEAVIESVALPSGSSRIKRMSQFNVSLNSYLGGFVGHEWIQGANNWPVINNYAVSAPIGVSFTWGLKKYKTKEKTGWGLGGFVSIIDLGALASFRVTDDTTVAVASKVELQDIIAPGAYFTVNFPKSPITVALGAQMGPLLRKIEAENHFKSNNNYWRVGITFAVDIPLLNLYNREEQYKNQKY